MKKRKTGLTIILVILAVFVAGSSMVVIWQWSNIKAFLYAKQYTQEQRQEQLVKQQQDLQQKVAEMQISLTPLTKDEEELLRQGTIDDEDALRIIKGESTVDVILAEKAEDGGEPTEPPKAESTPVQSDGNLQDLLARVYLLRSGFNGRIDGLIAQGKADYVASKGKESKLSIAQRYLAQGNALEAECDSQMEALIAQIEAEVQRTGGDSSLSNEIRSAYEAEKEAKKAELIEKYS